MWATLSAASNFPSRVLQLGQQLSPFSFVTCPTTFQQKQGIAGKNTHPARLVQGECGVILQLDDVGLALGHQVSQQGAANWPEAIPLPIPYQRNDCKPIIFLV